jgi:hypothetical protein
METTDKKEGSPIDRFSLDDLKEILHSIASMNLEEYPLTRKDFDQLISEVWKKYTAKGR